MENEVITTEQTCSFCKKIMQPDAIFCNHCGYPEHGTEQDKAKFFGQRAMQKHKNIDSKSKVKSARNTLYILAAVLAVFGFIDYQSHQQISVLGISFGLSLVFLGLGFWSEKKPVVALLIGLLLYLTLITITAIVDPRTLFQGILWKVIIISFLGKGMYSALSIKKVENP
jgi:hypothetical protein